MIKSFGCLHFCSQTKNPLKSATEMKNNLKVSFCYVKDLSDTKCSLMTAAQLDFKEVFLSDILLDELDTKNLSKTRPKQVCNEFIMNSTNWASVLVLGCENALKKQTLVN